MPPLASTAPPTTFGPPTTIPDYSTPSWTRPTFPEVTPGTGSGWDPSALAFNNLPDPVNHMELPIDNIHTVYGPGSSEWQGTGSMPAENQWTPQINEHSSTYE
jgi:hypothetical protein